MNGGGLQREWERSLNGLHKALFIRRAPTQPVPVPVRRRDVASGVCVFGVRCRGVWDVCAPVVCAFFACRLAEGTTRHPTRR